MLFMAAQKFNNNEKKTNLEKNEIWKKNQFEKKKIVYCDVYHRNHLIYTHIKNHLCIEIVCINLIIESPIKNYLMYWNNYERRI